MGRLLDRLGSRAERYGDRETTQAWVYRGTEAPTVVAIGTEGTPTAVHGPEPVAALDAAGVPEADAWLCDAPAAAPPVRTVDRPVPRLAFDPRPEIGYRVGRFVTGDRLGGGPGVVTRRVQDAADIDGLETVGPTDCVGPFVVDSVAPDARPGCVETQVETADGRICRKRGEDGSPVVQHRGVDGRGPAPGH